MGFVNRVDEGQGVRLYLSTLLVTWVVWLVPTLLWLCNGSSWCSDRLLLSMLDVVIRMIMLVSF